MSALPYHKRYHGDALTGFMALTLEERGAYQTLLDLIYDRGGPLFDNERLLAGYMNCSIRKWRLIRQSLLEKGKIVITKDALISNSRARKEIENQSKTHRKLIESGAKGGRTRAENEKNSNENNEPGQATLEPALPNPSSIRARTRSQKLEEKKKSSVDKSTGGEPPDPLKDLFDLGVSILTQSGSTEKEARSLIGKWRKHGDERVIATLIACRTKAISNPIEWITKSLSGSSRYVSGSGYEYRGTDEEVMRQAERRADWDTYWKIKAQVAA